MKKVAIIDNQDVLTLLNSAKTQTDQVRAFMMVAYGLHPNNMRQFTTKNLNKEGLLQFKRAKNDKPRRELIPVEQAEVIRKVIMRGKLKITNRAYEYLLEEMGRSIPHYESPPVSPLTLRHTYILNQMRRYNFDMELVSIKAGCNAITVKENYLDLDQWEQIHKAESREYLDLTTFEFMER